MSAKILIVEDDLDYQDQVRQQLQKAGYDVVAAESAPQARELFAREKPDLVVVDLMLDHLDDGFVLCYQFKRDKPHLPVVMVTGVTCETDMEFDASTDEERMWIKADRLLHKPLRFETLHKEIVSLLEGGT